MISRRVAAYLIDLVFIFLIGIAIGAGLLILTILSFGLLGFLWWCYPLLAVGYTTLLVGGPRAATWGMRIMGLEVRRTDGLQPGPAQALLFALLFYATVALTGWLIVLVALVTPRHRTVHDYLSGVVVSPAHDGSGILR